MAATRVAGRHRLLTRAQARNKENLQAYARGAQKLQCKTLIVTSDGPGLQGLLARIHVWSIEPARKEIVRWEYLAACSWWVTNNTVPPSP